jgi:hypothetical protein
MLLPAAELMQCFDRFHMGSNDTGGSPQPGTHSSGWQAGCGNGNNFTQLEAVFQNNPVESSNPVALYVWKQGRRFLGYKR